jgi:hypothetical protein
MTTDVASQLSSFNNTKLFIHSQRDDFFRKGVSIRSNNNDETKAEEGRTTRLIEPSLNETNPLELDAEIAHFKVRNGLFARDGDIYGRNIFRI